MGWRSFRQPLFGIRVFLVVLPLLKTSGRAGVLSRIALPDVITFLVLSGTLTAFLLGKGTSLGQPRLDRATVLGLVGTWTAIVLSLLGTDPGRESALQLVIWAANTVLLLLIVMHVRSERDLLRCVSAWELGVIVATTGALAGVGALLVGNLESPFTNGIRVASTFKKSGQLSSYLVGSLPILWFQLAFRSPTRRQRVLRRMLVAAAVVSVLATASRTGAVVGLVLTVSLFVVPWLLRVARRPAPAHVLAISAGALLLLALREPAVRAAPEPFRRALSAVREPADLRALSDERYTQVLAWRAAASGYPITGLGLGASAERITDLVPRASNRYEIHNTLLGCWAETGIVGAVALVLLALSILRVGWRVNRDAANPRVAALALALLLSLAAVSTVGVTVYTLRMRYLWAAAALLLALANVSSARPVNPRSGR